MLEAYVIPDGAFSCGDSVSGADANEGYEKQRTEGSGNELEAEQCRATGEKQRYNVMICEQNIERFKLSGIQLMIQFKLKRWTIRTIAQVVKQILRRKTAVDDICGTEFFRRKIIFVGMYGGCVEKDPYVHFSVDMERNF